MDDNPFRGIRGGICLEIYWSDVLDCGGHFYKILGIAHQLVDITNKDESCDYEC